MYNFAKTLSNSYSAVSFHAIKSVQQFIRNSSQGNIPKKNSSLPIFPLLSFKKIIDEVMKRCICHYSIHPEKLKQIIKANESQTLCNFFGSAEYQKRLETIMENQKRLLSEGSPIGIPEAEIKYEHIISCAQPVVKSRGENKKKRNIEKDTVITLLETKKKKKPVRTTIMSLILRKKKQEQEEMVARRGQSTIMPLVLQTKMRNQEMKKRFRRKTTILPIFLQKMEQIKEQNERATKKSGEELPNSYYKTKNIAATKLNKKSDFEKQQEFNEDENSDSLRLRDESTRSENNFVSKSLFKGGNSVSENWTTSAPRYLEDRNRDYIPKLSEPTEFIIENEPSNAQGLNSSQNFEKNEKAFWGEFVKKWKRSSKEKPRKQELSKSCEMNLPMDAHYEIDPSFVDIIDVSHFLKTSKSPPEEFSQEHSVNLFDRMKKGSIQRISIQVSMLKINCSLPGMNIKHNRLYAVSLPLKITAPLSTTYVISAMLYHSKITEVMDYGSDNTPLQPFEKENYSKRLISSKISEPYVSRSPSSTYMNVCDTRARNKQVLIDNCLRKHHFMKKKVLERPRIYTEKKKKGGTPHKTEPLALTYPSNSNKVAHSGGILRIISLLFPFFYNYLVIYLVSLPKTTPEGYRILLYSVKDNDPTKMVFSDCIKAFCMFNDVILSEDGLQEGYIVVFDMKGVQLGHLARVNLPALRCFMMYIQEAHPCRLKAIHILNTASWIHHVMRLIMPLLKSELLSLIKFHRGNVPDNLPTELLPLDYGGESATMEELEKDTHFLLEKYHHWLIESADYKSDESKRAKKASWWGLFNGSNRSNDEVDEKSVLKNLQID